MLPDREYVSVLLKNFDEMSRRYDLLVCLIDSMGEIQSAIPSRLLSTYTTDLQTFVGLSDAPSLLLETPTDRTTSHILFVKDKPGLVVRQMTLAVLKQVDELGIGNVVLPMLRLPNYERKLRGQVRPSRGFSTHRAPDEDRLVDDAKNKVIRAMVSGLLDFIGSEKRYLNTIVVGTRTVEDDILFSRYLAEKRLIR